MIILRYVSKYQNIDIERFARIFKALSNPHRLNIFLNLLSCCQPGTACDLEHGISRCIGELGKDLVIVPSTLSHHMKELNRAGLVKMERRGKVVECRVDPDTLKMLSELFLEVTH